MFKPFVLSQTELQRPSFKLLNTKPTLQRGWRRTKREKITLQNHHALERERERESGLCPLTEPKPA